MDSPPSPSSSSSSSSTSVAIEINVVDNYFNPPEIKPMANKFVTKIPFHCDFRTIGTLICEQYPVLRDCFCSLYYFNKHGLKTTMFDFNLPDFWKHQNGLTNSLCVINVNAMCLKLPEKKCIPCGGGLYGYFYKCHFDEFYTCIMCNRNDNQNCESDCPEHGNDSMAFQRVQFPPDVAEAKRLDQADEERNHRLFHAQNRGSRRRHFAVS